MRRLLLAAVALLLVAVTHVATATAATAPASGPPSAAALAAAGLVVAWPVRGATAKAAPGQRLVVTVRRTRTAKRPFRSVRVALVRLAGNGRPAATLATRALRSGRFAVTLPAERGVAYRLSLRLGSRTFATRLDVAAAPPVPRPVPAPVPAPAPQPAPAPPAEVVLPPCCKQVTIVTAALDRPSAAPGEVVGYSVSNVGDTDVDYTFSQQLQRRLADGSWQQTEPFELFPQMVVTLPAHTTKAGSVKLPDDAQPGRHRIVTNRYAGQAFTLEFDVVAP